MKNFLTLTALILFSTSVFATGWKQTHNHHNDIDVNVEAPVINIDSPKVNVGSPIVNVDAPKIHVDGVHVNVDAPKIVVNTPKDGLATQDQRQEQYIKDSANNTNIVEGDHNSNYNSSSISEGAINNSNDYTSNYQSNYVDRIQHVTPQFGQNCVGSACKSTSSIFITGGHDEMTGNSVNIGIAIPIGGGGKTASRAMRYESKKLKDRNRQDRERHQGEMALLCLQLHELTRVAEGMSRELWHRCSSYIPHKNHIKTGRANTHRDYTTRQVSPHNGAVDPH